MNDPVTEYAALVLSGKIPAGPYVIWACERHFRDMEREDIYLDLQEVEKRVRFFRLLKHWKGEYAGWAFELAQWQVFRVGSVYGWKYRSTGLRRFAEAYTEIPRKNGKTTEAAGVGLAGMLIDGEPGAEIYSVATKRDQAKIVWEDAKQMVQATGALSKRVRTFVSNISCQQYASKFEALGRDSKTLDGLNPHTVLYDEYHAYRDPYLRSVMQNALGSRRQPVEWIITTAGNDTATMCYELREHCINVLNPERPDFEDDGLFAYIACPFPEDDPGDPLTWARANPNLGISKRPEYMAKRWEQACMLKSQMNEFLSKHLNIWTEATETWLPMEPWRQCVETDTDFSLLEGQPCYAGLDLASVNDLSSLQLLFPFDAAWLVLSFFWAPEEDIKQRAKIDKVPYDLWARDGYIKATPGNATDFEVIQADIIALAERYKFTELLYDRWQSHQLVQNLIAADVNCVGYGQGYKDQSPALQEIERRVIGQTIRHLGNPVMDWCVGNAQVLRDPAGNLKLNKKDPRKRIDGVAGLANAVGGAILSGDGEGPSVYEERGVLEL